MKRLCLVALVTLAGCDGRSKQAKACESLLMPALKAPSTYKLVKETLYSVADGSSEVTLEYDAANSYNAPIRDTFVCTVDASGVASAKPAAGEQEPDNLDADILKPAAETSLTNISGDSTGAVDPFEVPVCDRPDSPEKRAMMNELGVGCSGE